MDLTAYLRDARERMHRHGFFLQAVTSSGPFSEPYVYSAGLQHLGHPELIAFAGCSSCSAALLTAAHDRVADGGAFEAGEVVELSGTPVRVEPVLAEWVDAYAGLAAQILDRPDVAMVQLVLPDERGRWPDESPDDPAPRRPQPLLSRDPAWPTPIIHDAEADLFADPDDDEPVLAVPVLTSTGREGRFELVHVEPLGTGSAVVVRPPWVADHVAVGDVVAVRPLEGLPGCHTAIGQMGALLQAGGSSTRVYRLPETAEPALGELLWGYHESTVVSVSTTLSTLHLNTVAPTLVDRDLRPFVRDGVLVPLALRSGDEVLACQLEGCVTCG